MGLTGSKYTVELWNKGVRQGVLSGLAANLKITKSRNEADDIQFDIPLQLLEEYARESYKDPKTLLITRQTEVKIKRGAVTWAGGQIYNFTTSSSGANETIAVKASGFFNLLKERFVEGLRDYQNSGAGTNGPSICADLITYTQSFGPNWNFGLTVGLVPTVGPISRLYDSVNIKAAFQDLSSVPNYPFDFEFTPDKVVNFYARIGSQRPEIIFRYPGNILDYAIPNDGTSMANRIIVYGSGISSVAAPPEFRDDLNSQLNYGVRQSKLTASNVSVTDTLDQMGDAELQKFAYPLEVPTITINGNEPPYVTDYGIGDYVKLIFTTHPFINRAAMYRIEKIELTKDNNDNESVKLYLS